MKIGIDIRAIGYQRTGDETYTLQLIRSLAKRDIKNKYFLYTDICDRDGLHKIEKILAISNGNFKIISVTPSSKFFWTFYSLPRRAKKDNLDILHVQYITPFYLSKGIKLITTIHDISFARHPKLIAWKDLAILKVLIKHSLRRADKIIAISKFTKDEIIDVYGIDKSKVEMIYNGGVAREFKLKLSSNDVADFKRKHDIEKPYLLSLGTLQPRKNIPFLIKSFIELKTEYEDIIEVKDLSLVIRGARDGRNYDVKIDKMMESVRVEYPEIYKQIKFIGYVSNEEIPLIFKGAAIFCFTSIYEGFGLPLLEAMTVSTPVIVSDDSCFPEIVDGAGVVYETGNSTDWANQVKTLLTDRILKDSMIKAGVKRADVFSWDKNAKETIQLYTKINTK